MIVTTFKNAGLSQESVGSSGTGRFWPLSRGSRAYQLDEPLADPVRSPVLVENRKFLVKILDSRREYVRMQKLRYDVFHREFRKKKFPFGLDLDRYESRAKHLLVIDRETQKIVGSYRAICSHDPDHLYTSSEFDLDGFARLPGNKLELSRACVHRDYRTGIVLTLLWRGISEYMQRTDASYIFGIPSFKSVDPEAAAKIYRYFELRGHVAEKAMVTPHATHRMETFQAALAKERQLTSASNNGSLGGMDAVASEIQRAIPPLFHAYIKAGAKIVGEPSIDREFQCIDFFMALKLDEISPLFHRKYVAD